MRRIVLELALAAAIIAIWSFLIEPNRLVIHSETVPSRFGRRYAAGLIREGSKQLFVTTGIGTSILPVRFRVPPEIAILRLKAK